ncbi:hypothetical protein [Glutamicibacter sp. MCAF14]|uniref:hypothetical protein n=1 Tax=Glutamicibacter sp. MCAF14 TaxID=3233043 RepID=UPI003F8DD575
MTSRRRIIVLIVAVVAIALVVVASVLMSQDQDQSDSSAATTPTTPVKTSEYGFPISHIRLGEGGTKTAPDGKTPIGYTASCDDAVRAAVNYVAPLSSSPKAWDQQKATMKQIFASTEENQELIEASGVLTNEFQATDTYSLLEPGLYRVANCVEGKAATIQVPVRVARSEFVVDGQTSPAYTKIYFSVQQLVWEDNDWKYTASPTTATPFSDNQLQYIAGDQPPTNVGTTLNKLFVDASGNPLSRDGWVQLAK